MKVAILGGGGREHALYWKIKQSPLVKKVVVLGGNALIENSVAIDSNNLEAIKNYCDTQAVDYLIVGSETLLAGGIVSYLSDISTFVFGVNTRAARLESSKLFAKQFMTKYGVSTADFEPFENAPNGAPNGAENSAQSNQEKAQKSIEKKQGNIVVKYDGLAGGKGVWVCDSIAESNNALEEMEARYGKNCPFLIEDKIVGQEVSLMGFCDGKTIRLLQPSVDYKPLLEDDKGANTGGMGAVCPAPFWNEELQQSFDENIARPTLRGMAAEQIDYQGFIYFGAIIAHNQVFLLEYNVRLGDPETQVLLVNLKSDLMAAIVACATGKLNEVQLDFESSYVVAVAQVSGGYPATYSTGLLIEGIAEAIQKSLVFGAGIKKVHQEYQTNGGRVLYTVGQDELLERAIQKAYVAAQEIKFEGQFYRKDIGNF